MDDGSPYCHRKSIFLSMLHSVFRSQKLYFTHRRLPGITARFHVPVIPRSRLQIQLHRIEKTARLIILSGIKQQMLHRCIRCYTDSRIALFFFLPRLSLSRKRPFSPFEPHWIFQMIHLCVINFHFNILLHLIFENSPIFSFYHDPFREKRFCFAGKNIFICTIFCPPDISPDCQKVWDIFPFFGLHRN